MPIRFAPTSTGAKSAQLVLSSSTGNVSVPLTGTGVAGAPKLTITPTDLDFGSIPVGMTVTKTFDINNTGNLLLTLNKAAPPAPPFLVANPVAEGQQLSPDDTIRQAVTFAPTAVGRYTGTYQITGNDGTGPRNVTVHGVATNPSPGEVLGPAAKCLDIRGSASVAGTPVQIYQCNGTAAQRWTYGNDQTLSGLGKCLDVSGSGTANGTRVQLWTCNGTGAQTWTLQANGSLRNPRSGRCLDLPGGNATDGSTLWIYDCNGSAAQGWRPTRTISPLPPPGPILGLANKCLDVRNGSSANGTTVQLYACNGGLGSTVDVAGQPHAPGGRPVPGRREWWDGQRQPGPALDVQRHRRTGLVPPRQRRPAEPSSRAVSRRPRRELDRQHGPPALRLQRDRRAEVDSPGLSRRTPRFLAATSSHHRH